MGKKNRTKRASANYPSFEEIPARDVKAGVTFFRVSFDELLLVLGVPGGALTEFTQLSFYDNISLMVLISTDGDCTKFMPQSDEGKAIIKAFVVALPAIVAVKGRKNTHLTLCLSSDQLVYEKVLAAFRERKKERSDPDKKDELWKKYVEGGKGREGVLNAGGQEWMAEFVNAFGDEDVSLLVCIDLVMLSSHSFLSA